MYYRGLRWDTCASDVPGAGLPWDTATLVSFWAVMVFFALSIAYLLWLTWKDRGIS
jgi:hypothetical protein